MLFNRHSHLAGKHAFLSASKSAWTNYDEEKLELSFGKSMDAAMGTRLHAFAAEAIALGQKLPARPATTLSLYVNDAINYKMSPELTLYYSDNAFGTADALCFRRNRKTGRDKLQIHDLKNGVSHASPRQLEVYAAFFCLEYRFDPFDIEIELRIYQNNEVQIYEGDPYVIKNIMSTIETFDKRINEMKMEALS